MTDGLTDPERPPEVCARSLGDWRQGPGLGWALANIRELMPTRRITTANPRCEGPPTARQDRHPSGWPDDHPAWPDLHPAAVLVFRDGHLHQEWWAPGILPRSVRMVASITKSMVGFLVAELIDAGEISLGTTAQDVLPTLSGTGYGSARVQELLDMRTSVTYDGITAHPRDVQDAFHAAVGYTPAAKDSPSGIAGLIRSAQQRGMHGQDFRYDGVTTEVVAALLRTCTGSSLRNLLEEQLWAPMRAAHDGEVVVDRKGIEHSAGGVSMSPYDLGRFGTLVIDRIQAGPTYLRDLFATPRDTQHRYRGHWWLPPNPDVLEAHGQWGQWLHLNVSRRTVVVQLSAHEARWERRPRALAHSAHAGLVATAEAAPCGGRWR